MHKSYYCGTPLADEWRVVTTPYTLEEQYSWTEMPPQEDIGGSEAETGLEALDDAMVALLAEAHKGAGGKARAPATAAKRTVNLHTLGRPVTAKVTGNFRLTDDPEHDVRHIILDFGAQSINQLKRPCRYSLPC